MFEIEIENSINWFCMVIKFNMRDNEKCGCEYPFVNFSRLIINDGLKNLIIIEIKENKNVIKRHKNL